MRCCCGRRECARCRRPRRAGKHRPWSPPPGKVAERLCYAVASARGSVRRVARADNGIRGFFPSLLAIAGHRLAQESDLPLETPARGARIQMQPQANPVPHRQWLVLRMREQAARPLAVYEVRKALDCEHWRSMVIL